MLLRLIRVCSQLPNVEMAHSIQLLMNTQPHPALYYDVCTLLWYLRSGSSSCILYNMELILSTFVLDRGK